MEEYESPFETWARAEVVPRPEIVTGVPPRPVIRFRGPPHKLRRRLGALPETHGYVTGIPQRHEFRGLKKTFDEVDPTDV